MSIHNLPPHFLAKERKVSGGLVKITLQGSGVDKNSALLRDIATIYCFDYNAPPVFYPYDAFMQLADHCCRVIYPTLAHEDGLEKIGYNSVMYYFDTPVGQVLKASAKVLGVQKSAKLYLQKMRGNFPFGTHEFEVLSRDYIRFRIRGVPGTGAMVRGSFKASIEVAGGKVKRIKTTILDKEDLTHEIELC